MHSTAIKATTRLELPVSWWHLLSKVVTESFQFLPVEYLCRMATYAAYRHIELDKVGYSKKRVRNPSSEIFNVLCTPPSGNSSKLSSPRRSSDSFTKLFGSTEKKFTPRRASLTKQDVTNRNPVTGDGVDSWDAKPASRNSPRVHNERNPVTGQVYTIVSPATTPTKPPQNGFAHIANGTSTPIANGNTESVVNSQ